MTQGGFYLKQIEVGPMENFAYLLGDLATHQVILVDPAWEVDRLIKAAEAEDLEIVGALISHHHRDHTNGIEDLLNYKNCPIYIHKQDQQFVPIPKSNIHSTQDGESIKVGQFNIQFIHTPGHTPGSQCFLVNDHLVTGDTLFIDGCGRCDLPGGDPEAMYYTLTQKILLLPEATQIMPGHNYAALPHSSLKEQKLSNPYLRLAAESLNDFTKFRMRPR
ncbi:MAG: MBL fold metallo-hydrolase [Deltaproteobacteria bacterium]|nr:MBL fold metallo-hydrolase [Deltaproteobacteria bacterium]